MNVLIIGSKGFIGSALTKRMEQSGYRVWGCDVATDHAAEHYFQIDIANADFEEVFTAQAFDLCINCAGAASVPDSYLHPVRDYYVNTQLVFHMLEAIRKHAPACRFLQLSSAAVYGNPPALPVNEELPVHPLSPYGWHKYQTELLCREYHEVHQLHTSIVRIFSAFGNGLTKQLFWDWHVKISNNPELLIFGTGNESRDFIFIDDLTHALHCVALNSAFKAEIINIGNGKEILIKDAIELFRKHCSTSFTYRFNNEVRRGDPLNWKADITRLQQLGYTQQTPFEEGILQYLQWLSERK